MIYVALLRGINVGGKNKINMKELKQTFERIGLEKVVTYINSGNIVFTDNKHSKEQLTTLIEDAILSDCNLNINVLIRNFEEIKTILSALPENWRNDKEMKSDVLFLWDEIDDPAVLEELPIRPEMETVLYTSGAILWSVNRINMGKSGMAKIIGTNFYKKVTIRNVNTTRKIYELMKQLKD